MTSEIVYLAKQTNVMVKGHTFSQYKRAFPTSQALEDYKTSLKPPPSEDNLVLKRAQLLNILQNMKESRSQAEMRRRLEQLMGSAPQYAKALNNHGDPVENTCTENTASEPSALETGGNGADADESEGPAAAWAKIAAQHLAQLQALATAQTAKSSENARIVELERQLEEAREQIQQKDDEIARLRLRLPF